MVGTLSSHQRDPGPIDLFTVICLVTWPLHESEAGVDLVVIIPPCFSYVHEVALMLISWNLHKKTSEVSIKTRSTLASLSFIGQVTKHTTVKSSISKLGAECGLNLLTRYCGYSGSPLSSKTNV